MNNQPKNPSVAILLNSQINDSLIFLKESLESVYCIVDFVAVASLDRAEDHGALKLLYSPSQLQSYDLIIYQYGCCFFTISSWLNDYDGKIIIQYHNDAVALSSLRPYHQATLLIRQTEIERQYFSEWVQSNLLRVFWLAGSPHAAGYLIGLGVPNTIDNITIVPPILELQEGKYACEKVSVKPAYQSILVTRAYVPETNHIMIINIIKDYQVSNSQNIYIRFFGKAYAELTVYLEGLKSHIKRLNLEPYIHLEFCNEPVEVETLMNADIMLSMDNDQQYSPNELQAQAMGLPVLKLDHTETPHTLAKLLEQALNDKSVREKLILKGYQNISSNYFLPYIKKTFLTSVISALRQ